MRIGTNPNRGNKAAQYTPIVLTAITHLPDLKGYHKSRLEVIQVCLETMRRNSGGDYTVVVWDNGSCSELTDWLKDEYRPDILVQSVNIGKTQARYSLSGMLPKNAIMTYCDDDILFYPNWLEPQLELLDKFPNVACVTGYPVRTAFRWGVENTHRWGVKYGKMQAGRFMPEQWESDFCASIGRDYEFHKKNTSADLDYIVEHNGISAYATSHHCQFIGTAWKISNAHVFDGDAMGDERKFDIALDEIGLRLATRERLTRHIGNIIDDNIRVEVDKCLNTTVKVF